MMNEQNDNEFAALIGLDWADQSHDICLQVCGNNDVEFETFEHRPEKINEWIHQLSKRFPEAKIAVCLEQSRGALIHSLMKHDNLVLFPINPKSLARFREALYPSGAKDDPTDAHLLQLLLRLHRDKLNRFNPDEESVRTLALSVEGRRKLVNLRTDLTNRLKSNLKGYYPQALELTGANLHDPLSTAFLAKWPTFQDLIKARPQSVRSFYYAHNSRGESVIKRRLEIIHASTALTHDQPVLQVGSMMTRTLVGQLKVLQKDILKHDQLIAQTFQALPDAKIFSSFPGAGAALAPRLLAAFGSDRSRYKDAGQIQKYSGIAPVIERSGKKIWVHFRWACPKFMRQSFHEFAGQSILFCNWAKAYYENARYRGKDHHSAVRALAFKWQRILWRCWQDRVPYDNDKYVNNLKKQGLEIYKNLNEKPIKTV